MGQLMIEQHYLTELSAVIEMFYICAAHSAVATVYMQPLSTSNVASETERLNFQFYLILINLNHHI